MTMDSAGKLSNNQLEESRDLCDVVHSQKSDETNQSDDVILRKNIITRTKHVSFPEDFALNTCVPNTNLQKYRICNRKAYLQLQRHSFSPGSNSTIEKLKGKYENSTTKTVTDLNGTKHNSTITSPNNFGPKIHPPDSLLVQNPITKPTPPIQEFQSGLSNKLDQDTLDKLRQKYSPKSFGYPKPKLLTPSKIPVPTPRNSLNNQNSKTVKVKIATVDKKEELKVPIITEVTSNNFEEVQLIYDNIQFAEPEEKHFIVTRSSSEDSIVKLENSLADFIMEKKPKEKKRSNSFRRILTGGLFGRDKKKQEEEKVKPKKKDNAISADNAQNESQVFDRHSSHRHTVDSAYPSRSMQQKNSIQYHNSSGPLRYYQPQHHYRETRKSDHPYTDMQGNSTIQFQQPTNTPEEYVKMDNGRPTNYLNVNKFIDTSSSSSNTLDSDSRNYTYQNSIIAQAELRHIQENENRKNTLQGRIPRKTCSESSSSLETFLSTPPRNLKAVNNVELVRPKALIPINSERPLPNPYHNVRDNAELHENTVTKTIERNLNLENTKPVPNKNHFYEERVKSPINVVVVEEIYGTVFDHVGNQKGNSPNSGIQMSPKSLEASKLKLPPNREKIELQPRIRSPIPQTKVSTDKIIATELLRNKGSPSRSPFGSMERQTLRSSRNVYDNQDLRSPNAHSTPRPVSNEYIHLNTVTSFAANKPPPSPRETQRASEINRRQKETQSVTLATVHADANDRTGIQQRNRTPSPHYMQQGAAFVPSSEKTYYRNDTHNKSSANTQNGRNGIQQRNQTPSPHYIQQIADAVPPSAKIYHRNDEIHSNKSSPNSYSHSMQRHSSENNMQTRSNVPQDDYETRTAYSEYNRSSMRNHRQSTTPPIQVNTNPENTYYNSNLLQAKRRAIPSPNIMQKTVGTQQYEGRQHQILAKNAETLYGTVTQFESCTINSRPHTPVGQNVVISKHSKSPEKQHMIENVEAFYWRQLKKLKEQEEEDLINYRQQQFHVYGYVEEPVMFRRSRSVSPTMQRGRRSLSLPRDVRPTHVRAGLNETILEGRPLIDKKPILLPNGSNEIEYGQIRQQFQRNPNFVRNTFERTTIGPIGRSRYHENYSEQPNQLSSTPIFKRGSLTNDGTLSNETQFQNNKKVSFSNTFYPTNPSSWPTKNGFTQSPPTRRVEREVSLEDDVFLPNSPRIPENRRSENIYMNDFDPSLHNNKSNNSLNNNAYIHATSVSAKPERPPASLYESAGSKHITVSNKVCDIYGQIHDTTRPNSRQTQPSQLPPHQNYGQIRQVGFVYGQLQNPPNQHSPVIMRQSFDHLNAAQPGFARGTRLTASVNDMYRRYPADGTHRVELVRTTLKPPNRPLPPVPERRDSRSILTKKFLRGYPQISDAESGSEAAGEVQRILNMGAKQKNFGAIGK